MAINVLMLGGKRTGKTSVLASMLYIMQQQNPFGGKVNFTTSNVGDLNDTIKEMTELFNPQVYKSYNFHANTDPTDEKSEYEGKVMNGNQIMTLHFYDIPGEFFEKSEHFAELKKLIRDCQILIIAVDSPHLVENVGNNPPLGKYHDVFNRPQQVSNCIQQVLSESGDNAARMVMFVPMKCEKYAHHPESKMNMTYLLDLVQKGYGDLLKFLEGMKDRCAVVIAPCMTMGGMEYLRTIPTFDEEKNELPPLVLNPMTGLYDLTLKTEYVFVEDNGKRCYSPKNCEQPLYYVLLFLLELTIRKKKKHFFGLLDFLGKLFPEIEALAKNAKKKDLLQFQSSLRGKLIKDEEQGFMIVNDPYEMF